MAIRTDVWSVGSRIAEGAKPLKASILDDGLGNAAHGLAFST